MIESCIFETPAPPRRGGAPSLLVSGCVAVRDAAERAQGDQPSFRERQSSGREESLVSALHSATLRFGTASVSELEKITFVKRRNRPPSSGAFAVLLGHSRALLAIGNNFFFPEKKRNQRHASDQSASNGEKGQGPSHQTEQHGRNRILLHDAKKCHQHARKTPVYQV